MSNGWIDLSGQIAVVTGAAAGIGGLVGGLIGRVVAKPTL